MRFGLPEDAGGWLALGLGLGALALGPWLAKRTLPKAWFVAIGAAAAAALSAAYVVVYLRGGPRIIDATTYVLEARALSRGLLSFPVDEPVASTLGRFLVSHDEAGVTRAAGIFPPGYPALLALGFLLRVPLAVGPALAAALAIATFSLATRVAALLARRGEQAASSAIPRLALALSVVCAALRYHTADTMSHGLAALCVCVALTAALDATDAASSRRRARIAAVTTGLAGGWLAATRPASALALGAALLVVAARADGRALGPRARLGALAALGALPGLALLLAHQTAATGALFGSSQLAYYAQSDGPPGCFRYGFGEGIGCLGEHSDLVRKHLEDGYGLAAATMTTLRRLKAHLVDVANLEPLALLVPIGAAMVARAGPARALAVAVLAQILAYAPFYFDGNYPGGGARLFADVLPIEHVLVAVAAVGLAKRWALPGDTTEGARGALAGSIVGLALVGFGVRASFDHALLRDRDGGRPMFEPALVAAAGAVRGLLYIDTDHGHALGFDPGAGPDALRVVRLRGDALDRMVWEARGRPPSYRYDFRIPPDGGRAEASVTPFDPGASVADRIEGESLWPAAEQVGAWAFPELVGGRDASGGRRLVARAAPGGQSANARVVLRLPAPFLRGRALYPRLVGGGEARLVADGKVLAAWPPTMGPARVPETTVRLTLELRPRPGEPLALDRIDLTAADEPPSLGETH